MEHGRFRGELGLLTTNFGRRMVFHECRYRGCVSQEQGSFSTLESVVFGCIYLSALLRSFFLIARQNRAYQALQPLLRTPPPFFLSLKSTISIRALLPPIPKSPQFSKHNKIFTSQTKESREPPFSLALH